MSLLALACALVTFLVTWPQTAAGATRPERTTIAWGSCASSQRHPQQPIWGVMRDASPDAVVLLGDTPYIDSTDPGKQRAAYATFFAREDVRALRERAPFYCTWDDHDFGADGADGRLPGKEHARAAFVEHHTNPSYGEDGQGVYTSFRVGPVEVFLLDTRWFARTEDAAGLPGRPTLLGAQQWAWLERGLRASTAPFKVLACGMIWNDLVRPDKDDHWGAYPHERERLFRFLGAREIAGVVLVGGDIHRSRVVRHATREVVGYEITELVTSPLAQAPIASADAVGPGLVWDVGVDQTCLVTTVAERDGELVLTARFLDERKTLLFATRLVASQLARANGKGPGHVSTGFLFESTSGGPGGLPCAVYRPRDWSPASRWPCVLFLHGMGECGTDGSKQLAVGLAPALLARPRDWPFVVLLPQKPRAEDEWEAHDADLIELLERSVRDHAVDRGRVALTGLSQGGHGTWEIARRHPKRFVALAPLCGYPAAPELGWARFDARRDWASVRQRAAADAVAAALKGVPVWAFHGEADGSVPAELSRIAVGALRAAGAEPKLTVWPRVEHDCWTRAYGEGELAAWLRSILLAPR